MDAVPPVDEMFSAEAMVHELAGRSKPEVIEEMVKAAVRGGVLPKGRVTEVIEAITTREDRGSTGMGRGIAIPHAKISGLRKPAGVVARSSGGIDFKAVDGEPVTVLVMLISPENKPDEHLAMLRWVSTMARDPDFASFIRQARNPDDMLDVLVERAG